MYYLEQNKKKRWWWWWIQKSSQWHHYHSIHHHDYWWFKFNVWTKNKIKIEKKEKKFLFKVSIIYLSYFSFFSFSFLINTMIDIHRLHFWCESYQIPIKMNNNKSLGRPGVDISLRHVTEFAVLQIIFIINEVNL